MLFLVACFILAACSAALEPRMSDERVVFQTKHGDIEFGFYPDVAPKTVKHIFDLVVLGCFQHNHIFRVDKGFVAQVAGVDGGRSAPMNAQQQAIASLTVPLEVVQGVKHHEGVLSMGRYSDPDSGGSSFSFLLGDAPHLDMTYTIFGKVTKGLDVLHELEKLETKREGIFVMPLERVTITGTYWYLSSGPVSLSTPGSCEAKVTAAKRETEVAEHALKEQQERFLSQAEELQRVRKKCLPV